MDGGSDALVASNSGAGGTTDAGSGGRRRGDSLALRVLSAAVFLPFLYLITLAGGVGYTSLVSLMVLLGLIEFYEMLRAKGERPYRLSGLLAGLVLLWTAQVKQGIHANLLLTSVLLVLMSVELFRRDNRGALHNISGTVFGVLYVAWLGSHLILLRQLPVLAGLDHEIHHLHGASMVFFLFACVWGCDTSAYVFGKLFGRRRLLPRVSPHKSVEGAIGGTLTAALIGYVSTKTYAPFVSPWIGTGLGLLIAVVGQIGDMVESLLKRDTERKDSAVTMWIPGHGGVLDRFDSALFAAPVLYYALKAIYL